MVENMDLRPDRITVPMGIHREMRTLPVNQEVTDLKPRRPDGRGLRCRTLVALTMGFGVEGFEAREMQHDAALDH